jgi:hypothetical protein
MVSMAPRMISTVTGSIVRPALGFGRAAGALCATGRSGRGRRAAVAGCVARGRSTFLVFARDLAMSSCRASTGMPVTPIPRHVHPDG